MDWQITAAAVFAIVVVLSFGYWAQQDIWQQQTECDTKGGIVIHAANGSFCVDKEYILK